MLSSSRIGFALLLALLVPAAFTAAWAWLVHGGAIQNAIDNEQAEVARCQDAVAGVLQTELANAGRSNLVRIHLNADGFADAPFLGRPIHAAADAEPGIAEATARAQLAAGDASSAQPFFQHAHEKQQLTAIGALAYANLLTASDPTIAEQVIASAAAQHADAWCGPLPFSLLHALHRLRNSPEDPDNATAVLQAAQLVATEAVPAVIAEMLAAQPALRSDRRIAELRAAAVARALLATNPVTRFPMRLADGIVVVPSHNPVSSAFFPDTANAPITDVCALPEQTVATIRDQARALATEQYATLAVALPTIDPSSWTLQRTTTATSTSLTYVARACLLLAIATLLLGNLLLWRLSRRELALVRLRRDFVDVVSHELRTPLTALSLKAEMLANGDVPAARQQHYLHTLHSDVHRLTDQVERILDFGHLERGAPLHRQVVPTRSLLAKGLRAGLPALRLVQQNLAIDVPRSLPPLDADVEVLARALRNLLENAAKYAPAGSTVAVRAFAAGNSITVEVADSGPGVAIDERQTIFQPFVRASSATPGIQGSGLGLALVAAAAKAHGGTVNVHDRQGGGAVFTISLPVAKEHAS